MESSTKNDTNNAIMNKILSRKCFKAAISPPRSKGNRSFALGGAMLDARPRRLTHVAGDHSAHSRTA
eukprot:1443903-Pyramimonas_sp.AAC.1